MFKLDEDSYVEFKCLWGFLLINNFCYIHVIVLLSAVMVIILIARSYDYCKIKII